MDERSSKFVDQLALGKLINEKLSKVKHSPENSYFLNQNIDFSCIDKYELNESDVEFAGTENGISCYRIPSFCKKQLYSENKKVSLYYHPSKSPCGNILLVHGLFDDNRANYNFLINQLNELNFNVYFMVMPYHFERKPDESLFGGEYFFSADIYRTRNSFKQAVFDIEAAFQFIALQNKMPSRLVGFSMGGCVAFQYYMLKNGNIKTFLINPVTDLKRLPWDNQLLLTVGRDLKDSGFAEDEIHRITFDMDPCEKIGRDFAADNLSMVYSSYDQIIERSKYASFIKKTGIANTIEYPAGHLNVFRVPRLARDIYSFLNAS